MAVRASSLLGAEVTKPRVLDVADVLILDITKLLCPWAIDVVIGMCASGAHPTQGTESILAEV